MAINLFISSLKLDNPKSATGIGDNDESKLNLPVSEDNIIACEVYHLGKSSAIMIETTVTNPIFLSMNFLFVHKRSKFFCILLSEKSSISFITP